MFDEKYLRRLLDAHQSGVRDYSSPLWSLLMFQAFLVNARTQGSIDGEHSARLQHSAA
jgi:asparagine synthase (glutamine-hydrolysing)